MQRLFPKVEFGCIGKKSVWNEVEIQSCYVMVHMTSTSALDIANARTMKTAVVDPAKVAGVTPTSGHT